MKKVGLVAVQTLHKTSMLKKDESAGFFKLLTARDLICMDCFLILLSQACQLVFVPQRGIKLFLSSGHN